MNKITDTNERDRAVRALLVDTVERTSGRRRRHLGTVAGAIACVLGGAAVGGAVTAAASPDPAAIEAQSRAAVVVHGAGPSYRTVVGTPVGRVGSADETITVGTPPRGADTFVWVATCRTGNGVLEQTVSGRPRSSSSCTAGSTTSDSRRATDIAGRTVHITVHGDLGWTLSYGWLRTPPVPRASAAQDEAMEDGIVTRSEYLAAFDRFQGCMTARGASLGRIPTSSLFVAFGASDVYTLDWCTASEFDAVDTTWQAEHPLPAGADAGSWGSQPYDPAADPRYAG
ncbi:hypothetical protein ACTJKO_02270 [Curtobacterium sp. 22159]|uniref:hypothetical protein n=1 Tax=Curtobacterium sp. 22159 TaxID=3453882 RepID=UPI003F869049